jgi:hypothetical protein
MKEHGKVPEQLKSSPGMDILELWQEICSITRLQGKMICSLEN